MFHPSPSGLGLSGLLRRRGLRHWRRSSCSFVIHTGFHGFHFPASLGSTVVTRFVATTDALSPAGRLQALTTLLACPPSDPGRFPCLLHSPFPSFRLQPPSGGGAAFLSLTVCFSSRSLTRLPATSQAVPFLGRHGLRVGFRSAVAGSSRRLAESSSLCLMSHETLLRTDSSPPAAPHPVSPRRSSLQLQVGELRPDGDFHPAR